MNSMETKYYGYRSVGHAMRVFGAWGLTLVCLALLLLVSVGILTTDRHEMDESQLGAQDICDALAILLGVPMGALIGLANANMFPTVGVNPYYVTVSFCFCEFKIPWQDVIEITRVWYPVSRPLYAIRVKRLTPFHSLFYGSSVKFLSFGPAFLLSANIEGFDELMRELKNRLQAGSN